MEGNNLLQISFLSLLHVSEMSRNLFKFSRPRWFYPHDFYGYFWCNCKFFNVPIKDLPFTASEQAVKRTKRPWTLAFKFRGIKARHWHLRSFSLCCFCRRPKTNFCGEIVVAESRWSRRGFFSYFAISTKWKWSSFVFISIWTYRRPSSSFRLRGLFASCVSHEIA